MGVWKSIAGTIRAKLTSADPAGTLTAINNAGINILAASQVGDLSVELLLYRKDWRALMRLTEKRGEKLEIVKRYGIYWTGKRLLGRPVLLAGMTILFFFVFFLPSRVFFVRVEGNVEVPAQKIIEQAELCGIRFGASRREVRSERIKNELLGTIPELQWAGVNTSGCVATISVRERSQAEEASKKLGVCSIVADRDGVITEMTVLQGNGLCKIGQAVEAGEVLISGYTDLGLSIQATRAQGEIYAQTNRQLLVQTLESCTGRGEAQSNVKKFSLRIGKKQINFYKGSGILDSSCDKMYTEYTLTLPGGFTLPVTLIVEQWIKHEDRLVFVEADELQETLLDFSERYLQSQMVAGRILERQERIEQGYLYGDYACLEMIGREQSEEIIESNGKGN